MCVDIDQESTRWSPAEILIYSPKSYDAQHNRFVIISIFLLSSFAFPNANIFFPIPVEMQKQEKKDVGKKCRIGGEGRKEREICRYIMYIYINMVTRTYWVVRDTHHVMRSNKERKKREKNNNNKNPPLFLLSGTAVQTWFGSTRGPSDIYMAVPERKTLMLGFRFQRSSWTIRISKKKKKGIIIQQQSLFLCIFSASLLGERETLDIILLLLFLLLVVMFVMLCVSSKTMWLLGKCPRRPPEGSHLNGRKCRPRKFMRMTRANTINCQLLVNCVREATNSAELVSSVGNNKDEVEGEKKERNDGITLSTKTKRTCSLAKRSTSGGELTTLHVTSFMLFLSSASFSFFIGFQSTQSGE